MGLVTAWPQAQAPSKGPSSDNVEMCECSDLWSMNGSNKTLQKCSRTRHAVVPQEFATRLQKLVDRPPKIGQDLERGSQPTLPQPAHLSPHARHSTILQTLVSHSATHESTQVASDCSPDPGQAFRTTEPRPRVAIFFMAYDGTIFPWGQGLRRSKIYSSSLCDNLFYSQMREEYWKHPGWWGKWLGLYTFESCDFYLVSTSFRLPFAGSHHQPWPSYL